MSKTGNERASLVGDLLRSDSYPHPTGSIQMRQTHVSHLFFTGKWVYKVKKPVELGFLDFSTLEKRHLYCRREVELNRRLSPDVYLGVVPITRGAKGFRIEGSGRPVEYAVKMVQIPADRSLDRLLRCGQISCQEIRSIAVRIAEFHQVADRGPGITRLGSREMVIRNWEENFRQILPYVGRCLSQETYDDLWVYSRAFLEVRAAVFESRAREGRVLDGHGDLHAANVFLDGGVRIIDCIEFNDRFRCLDPAEDIAFLAMDLDRHGREDLSRIFVEAYLAESGDDGVLELLDFFKIYMACVRGKVDSFRIDDATLPEQERSELEAAAAASFHLSRAYTRPLSSRPGMVVMSGLMGAGKTYLSRHLADRWEMVHLASDLIRKELAGVAGPGHRYQAYQEVADEEEIRRRLDRRVEGIEETVSDGRWEIFPLQRAAWEPIEEGPDLRLDTTAAGPGPLLCLLEWLFARALTAGADPPPARDTPPQ